MFSGADGGNRLNWQPGGRMLGEQAELAARGKDAGGTHIAVFTILPTGESSMHWWRLCGGRGDFTLS